MPEFSVKYVEQLWDFIALEKYAHIATICGRYYAMDRDKRWERMQIAYEGMVAGKGDKVFPKSIVDVLYLTFVDLRSWLIILQNASLQYIKNERYAKNETDEFLKPIILDESGCIKGMIV